ncbi:MAG: amino acid ABC transporter permease [Actinomycetota bacterium]
MAIGVFALLVGLFAFYRVSTEGRHGRALALTGVSLALAGGVTSLIYGAIADHTLRLGRFFNLYFDLTLLRQSGPDLARGAVNTIKAAFLAEVIAVILGLIVATFRLAQRRVVRGPAVVYINVLRGLPLVVLAALVTYGLPAIGLTLGTLAAVVTTLVLNASAYVAEIFRAGIQSLPRGQMDAARSLGMTRGAAMTSVVIPQAFRAVIPPLMNEFVALIKDTAIVYTIVGVTVATRDMYTAAQNITSSTFSPTPLIGASIGYLIITIPLAWLVGRVERRLRAGLA